MLDIISNNEFVIHDEEREKKENVIIELVDYGDNFYDVHLLNKIKDSLFGSTALCGIEGLEKAQKIANEISQKHGLELRIIKGDNEEFSI